jgi:hypothetical protein
MHSQSQPKQRQPDHLDHSTGCSVITMSYADTSQDERVSAGDKTFDYNLLGLTLESQSGTETQ